MPSPSSIAFITPPNSTSDPLPEHNLKEVIECSAAAEREFLELTKQDIVETTEWAIEESEPAPTAIAIEIALRVSEGLMPFWPQHFDVYPLDGNIAIDSGTVNKSFAMVVCKNNGTITTLITVQKKRLRKEWQEDEVALAIDYTGRFLVILRKMKGVTTFGHSINSWRKRISGEGYFYIDLTQNYQEVSTWGVSITGLQTEDWKRHLSRQAKHLTRIINGGTYSIEPGLTEGTHIPWMGSCQSVRYYGQQPDSGVGPYNTREPLPRPYQTAALP